MMCLSPYLGVLMLILASLILISSLHILDSDHHEAQAITQGIIAQEADNYTKDNATMEEYSPHRQRRLEGASI